MENPSPQLEATSKHGSPSHQLRGHTEAWESLTPNPWGTTLWIHESLSPTQKGHKKIVGFNSVAKIRRLKRFYQATPQKSPKKKHFLSKNPKPDKEKTPNLTKQTQILPKPPSPLPTPPPPRMIPNITKKPPSSYQKPTQTLLGFFLVRFAVGWGGWGGGGGKFW